MNTKLLAKLAIAAVFALTCTVATVGPADASTVSSNTAKAPKVCWLNTDDQSYRCFASEAAFEGAVAAAGSSLRLQPGSTSSAVSPATTYVLATFYMDEFYGGSSLNITTSISTYCSTHNYTGNSMPAGWNNDVSSFHTYGNCYTELYDLTNKGGSHDGPYKDATALGVFNDAASSYFITGI